MRTFRAFSKPVTEFVLLPLLDPEGRDLLHPQFFGPLFGRRLRNVYSGALVTSRREGVNHFPPRGGGARARGPGVPAG